VAHRGHTGQADTEPRPDWPPAELPASALRDGRRTTGCLSGRSPWPPLAADPDRGRAGPPGAGLFSSTTVAPEAYILALLIAMANGVAARIEDDDTRRAAAITGAVTP